MVLPAHAGVILLDLEIARQRGRITRTCGGDPILIVCVSWLRMYYPHMRG